MSDENDRPLVRPWTPLEEARLAALTAELGDIAQSFRDILRARPCPTCADAASQSEHDEG